MRIVYVRNAAELAATVARYRPEGIVLNVYFPVNRALLRSIPTVRLACEGRYVDREAVQVRYDSGTTARLAVRELESRGCRNYAFASIDWHMGWSRARCESFVREVGRRGGILSESFLSSHLKLTASDRVKLGKWVRELPKPCGVFASNDAMARGVIDACIASDVSVPNEVAVVGVDDDFTFCQHHRPTLTSVIPDLSGSGFIAMSALDDVIRGAAHAGEVRFFHPLGLCRRESTGCRYSREDFRVIKVMDLIRNRACIGLDVPTVVRAMGCSRRYAENVFRATTGMTILEAIRNVRFDAAQALLRSGNARVSNVAVRSGYASVQTFIREFKKLTGSTPRSWLRRNVF